MGRRARHQDEIESVREGILHAAGRAFARQGFDATTIHDVAKEAGYTAPSLYAYFKGKQEIIEALITAIQGQFEAAFEAEIPAGLEFAERLGLLFGRLAEVVERWPETRLLLIEFKRSGQAALRARQRRTARRNMDAKLTEWLKRNVTSPKELGGRAPDEIVFILQSLITGCVLPAIRKGSDPRERFALALHVFLHGIGGG
jgi:AcrR family transcriptional regulator